MPTCQEGAAAAPASADHLQSLLRTWRLGRKARKANTKRERPSPASLPPVARTRILAKTDGRWHICGGQIEAGWQADHVLAHSGGGKHGEDNYLAAHALCNNYRWDYLAEEFQYILKLGVWARTQIEYGSPVGHDIANAFVVYERRRCSRRRPLVPKRRPAV